MINAYNIALNFLSRHGPNPKALKRTQETETGPAQNPTEFIQKVFSPPNQTTSRIFHKNLKREYTHSYKTKIFAINTQQSSNSRDKKLVTLTNHFNKAQSQKFQFSKNKNKKIR